MAINFKKVFHVNIGYGMTWGLNLSMIMIWWHLFHQILNFFSYSVSGNKMVYRFVYSIILEYILVSTHKNFKCRGCVEAYKLKIDWKLTGNFLTAAWQLPNSCLTAAWQLPENYLTSAWQLLDNCLTTAWQLQTLQ